MTHDGILTLAEVTIFKVVIPAWDSGPGQIGSGDTVLFFFDRLAAAASASQDERATVSPVIRWKAENGQLYNVVSVEPPIDTLGEGVLTLRNTILNKLTAAERAFMGFPEPDNTQSQSNKGGGA